MLFKPVFDNGPQGYGYERVQEYWREFSPIHSISEKTPPTIVFLGTEDSYVHVKTAEKNRKLMVDKGCRCDLHLYDGQLHGFFDSKHPVYSNRTLMEIDHFLTSLGYLALDLAMGKTPDAVNQYP